MVYAAYQLYWVCFHFHRNATCDYSQCFSCQDYNESQVFDNISDIPSCTFGCFCIRSHNAEVCVDPPLCEVSNLCHDPELVCGCPVCQDAAGDCFAKSADDEEILISGDGPQNVGCAVCTCNLPTIPVPAPSYTQALLPVRTAKCDYSQCVCYGYDESQVFDNISDIPSCTFGCFCIKSENVALCIDPAPCELSNRCQHPGDVCGCPVCSDSDDCFAKSFDDEEVLISGDGPQNVGCAVCTCDAPVTPITLPFFTPDTPIPLLPVRNATCDYSQCVCQDYKESQVFDNISDIPGCTFGCFCIRSHNAALCIDPGLCEVSNLCHDPELVCGCPTCQDAAGDCFAKSADDEEILISGDGPQIVGCAVCTCNLPTIPVPAPSYTQALLPVRTATCDYSQCVCHNYDESQVFDNLSDIPSCTFGCFCIRSENVALCIDPAPCELSNRCQHPGDVCGCPVCSDTDDDCFAKSFEDEEVLISGDGPQDVGCAVCTCAAPVKPITIPFFTPDTPLPLLPVRGYSCDYSGCYNPYGK
ncbi:uncharacterized protein LOC117105458 [Anneissia japonica]|uniref:uncharacterized protein LOC117105458 n=1 Tax=Anneissia japonica TaxID=1529436 RepID=UPI001425660B|nr:uncharacterized protein LOC117105458 [Anneissia japonica]